MSDESTYVALLVSVRLNYAKCARLFKMCNKAGVARVKIKGKYVDKKEWPSEPVCFGDFDKVYDFCKTYNDDLKRARRKAKYRVKRMRTRPVAAGFQGWHAKQLEKEVVTLGNLESGVMT